VFLGPPGAGKGTQAVEVARELGLCHVSTGDLLRDAIRDGTELGRAAERTMASGALVADDVILELVREAIGRPGCREGAVFDGFPRTQAQAEGLAALLEEAGAELGRVVLLDLPEEEVVRRLSSRRICERCGRVSTPAGAADETCGFCGGPLVQRPDDRPETVRRRLRVYREQTEPLLAWYRTRGLVRAVDGSGGIGQVRERVLREVA
jgi:adenylate kinase